MFFYGAHDEAANLQKLCGDLVLFDGDWQRKSRSLSILLGREHDHIRAV